MDRKRIDSSFDIDMIIAEVRELKDKRATPTKKAVSPAPPEEPAGQPAAVRAVSSTAAVSSPAEKKEADAVPEAERKEAERVVVPPPAVQQAEPLQNTRPHPREEAKQVSEPVPEAEEDVKIFVPRRVAQPAEPEHEKARTRVLPANSPEEGQLSEEDMDGQLRLEGFEEPAAEPQAEAPSEEELEQRLREARKLKVQSFKLAGDEEEDNDPSEEPEEYDDSELEDFTSYDDAETVQNELTYRRRIGWIQVLLTGAMELILLGVGILTLLLRHPPFESYLYVTLNLFFLGVMALINHRVIGEGIVSLLRMRATGDTGAALASLAALAQTVVQYFCIDSVTAGETVLLAPVAGLLLLFGSIGRLMMVRRVGLNFRFVSFRGEKQVARIIEDPRTASEIGRSAVAMGDPYVCYYKKAGFLTHFLENSYDDDPAGRSLSIYVPCAAGASLVVAVVYGLLTQRAAEALSLFTALLCASCPAAAMAAYAFPLLRASARALRRGGMIVGREAAERVGDLDAVVLDALDLFPAESVLLHGIKTFSGARIDEAILDAAAVSSAAGGPLSSVFLRVIENRTDILPAVDSLVYEQEMGLSGWVSGRRVLVGNRRLLENHGVDVPSRDYESRYTHDGRELVYLSTAGELSAMFVVSYLAEEGIMKALRSLTGSGITLLVRTCDPNITAERVCGTFDLDDYYVEVLGASAGRAYERLALGEEEEAEAEVAANGRAEGMAAVLTYSRRLVKGLRLVSIGQVMTGCLGWVLVAFLAFYAGTVLSAGWLLLYAAVTAIVVWLLPLIRKL